MDGWSLRALVHNSTDLPLKHGEFSTPHMLFAPDGRRAIGLLILELDVVELDAKGNRLGGRRIVRTAAGRKRPNWDGQLSSARLMVFPGRRPKLRAPCDY